MYDIQHIILEAKRKEDHYDIPARRHFCTQKPEDIIIERQQTIWHIHKTTIPHSKYRKDILDNKCPYCHRDLPLN